MKKIIAFICAVVMIFSFASCSNSKEFEEVMSKVDAIEKNLQSISGLIENNAGNNSVNVDNSQGESDSVDETEPSEDNSEVDNAETENNSEESSTSNKTSSSKTTTKVATSNSKSDIVAKYISAAKATDKNVKVTTQKTLSKIDGGEGLVGAFVSAIEPVAKDALAKNSGVESGVRGNPDLIKVSDIKSATIKNDGTYTTIKLVVNDYTAKATGRKNEGSVGHVVGVLDTLNEAIDQIGLTVADASNVRLVYNNAYVQAKINNKTNKIVSATWEYDVNVDIPNNKIKFSVFSITLKNASVVIHYKATL